MRRGYASYIPITRKRIHGRSVYKNAKIEDLATMGIVEIMDNVEAMNYNVDGSLFNTRLYLKPIVSGAMEIISGNTNLSSLSCVIRGTTHINTYWRLMGNTL